MITNMSDPQAVGSRFVEMADLVGLSTDSKPTDVANGSKFYEMDTGKSYRFDFVSGTWIDPTADPDDDEEEGGT